MQKLLKYVSYIIISYGIVINVFENILNLEK